MMLNRRSKYLSGGWTSVDMLMVMLAAGVAALLVSICFGRELRVGVFFISYLVFVAIFTSLFFSWLIPMLMRRQLQDAFLREHPGATILSTTSNDAIDTPGPRNIGFVYRNADGTEHQDIWHFGYSDHGWRPVKKEQIR